MKVGLGSDVAGGYQLDIMSAMRMAVVISRIRNNDLIEKGESSKSLEVSWKEAIYLATTGGATALGLPVGQPFQIELPFDAQQSASPFGSEYSY